MKIVDSKCPCCTSNLDYDIDNKNFKCKSCRNVYTIEQLKKLKPTTKNHISFDEISCPNCGAHVFTNNNIISTKCVYCGNNVIVHKTKDKCSMPDKIIPFSISKNSVKKIITSNLSKRNLLPKNFLSAQTLNNIEGIYVPFWLYTNDYDVKLSFFEDGQISIYKKLNADISFDLIPYDANKHLDNKFTKGLEPFNYQELINFEPAYLSGIMAQKYDIDYEAGLFDISERCHESIVNLLSNPNSKHYLTRIKFVDDELINQKHYYALLPIWLLNIKYNNKIYTIVVNGQTGKMVAELPIDNVKYTLFNILIFILVLTFMIVLFMLMRWVGIIC